MSPAILTRPVPLLLLAALGLNPRLLQSITQVSSNPCAAPSPALRGKARPQ